MSRRRAAQETKLFNQDYNALHTQCSRQGSLFEDPEFPAENSSIYFSKTPNKKFEWKRPSEICSDPQWITGGATRFDVTQGMLGDCWLQAAVSSLTLDKAIFNRVVPNSQSFSRNYCGIFKFNFWINGEWQEIVVDDRLPTYNNQLVFLHSSDKNEFWSALLEKAYAKLSGSYESLIGGKITEAMVDFTGGVAEQFNLNNAPDNLYTIMLRAAHKNSLMGCSIEANAAKKEETLPNGLVTGHSYSVTAVKMVEIRTSRRSGQFPMVRLRNTWGNEAEWNGPWSDKSREWQLVSTSEREEIGLTFDHDGEFWMTFEDFKKNFDLLEVCHLGVDSLELETDPSIEWVSRKEHGSWVRRVSAGGCRNYLNSFWTNPQYRLTLTDPDEDDDENLCTVVVSLMQKDRRRQRKLGKENLRIGYVIYKLDNNTGSDPLDYDFFKYHSCEVRSKEFSTDRDITDRHKIKPGNYVIVPSTFEPNEEGKFLLRIFTEKSSKLSPSDEANRFDDPDAPEPDPQLLATFQNLAGPDDEIDANELLEILNKAYKAESESVFNIEMTRSLVAILDRDATGKLGYNEFSKLWNDLRIWKSTFKKFDADRSGFMSSYELRNALHSCGFRISNGVFQKITLRHSNVEGQITIQQFIMAAAKLKAMNAIFAENTDRNNKAVFTLDSFLAVTIYS
ncbi:hypothetical protein RRG08_001204 [Elysia crispata]|uniref:Uncharacterized protein n=1 Tax=Elysia crispata TaxID=231223 RepID=A0AAE1EB37_9GAST|nr:hypothetical protein RRG08_001204 [Elysia crispata]